MHAIAETRETRLTFLTTPSFEQSLLLFSNMDIFNLYVEASRIDEMCRSSVK